MEWTKEKTKKLIELKNSGLTWSGIAEEMSARYDERYTIDSCRGRYRNHRHTVNEDKPAYKETIEHKGDNQVSDKLIALSDEELKDANNLLRAHNYDPSQWDLMKSKSGMWHHSNKEYGTKTLYASKITVKPKNGGFNFDELLDAIKHVTPIYIDHSHQETDKQLLELPFFDQHFGVNDYNHYEDTLYKTLNLINDNHWDEIVITIGSDMLHHDNMQNTTVKGTEIEHMDMTVAWNEAVKFYTPMITRAVEQSKHVKLIYVPGNHDQSLSWAFAKMLEAMYPQVEHDTSLDERKVHTFKEIFIGYAHGDKRPTKIANLFPAEFPHEWAGAKTRELHTGHIHHEVGKDEFGMMHRSLATRGKTDKWHKEMGYIGAHKRFMVFEYTSDELAGIHYV